jgi:hypothetical protein
MSDREVRFAPNIGPCQSGMSGPKSATTGPGGDWNLPEGWAYHPVVQIDAKAKFLYSADLVGL